MGAIEKFDEKAASTVTLDQWAAFVAVVETGGFGAAAQMLRKSQSSISYAIKRLETALALKLLRPEGRRAVLTEHGDLMYRRARSLLSENQRLTRYAAELQRGLGGQIRLGVDVIFPVQAVLGAVRELWREDPSTRVLIVESALSGTDELLLNREVDLAVTARVPTGFMGTRLGSLALVPVASHDHPLSRHEGPLSEQVLRGERQVVVRDAGRSRQVDVGWLGAEHRLTVSNFRTSVEAVRLGLGFAWLPLPAVSEDLARGRLTELELQFGGRRSADVFLVYADRENASASLLQLGERLSQHAPVVMS